MLRFCMLTTLCAILGFAITTSTADDSPEALDRRERQLAEMQAQMEAMRAQMEELRALLAEQREPQAPKQDFELPPELQERLHGMKREIQTLLEAGRVEEAEALEREAQAVLQRFAAEHHGHHAEHGDDQKIPLPPELAEQIERMQAEIRELKQSGRHDQAIAMQREVDEILHRHAHGEREQEHEPEIARRIDQMHREIAELRELGQLDKAEAMQRELEALMAHHAEGSGPHARLEHLRVAAEHLHAAGAHDLAERVVRQIEELERERRE